MFVAMGLSAVFPVLHGLRLYGASQMKKQIGLSWLVLQGVLYTLGAGIYAVNPYHVLSKYMQKMTSLLGPLARERASWEIRYSR